MCFCDFGSCVNIYDIYNIQWSKIIFLQTEAIKLSKGAVKPSLEAMKKDFKTRMNWIMLHMYYFALCFIDQFQEELLKISHSFTYKHSILFSLEQSHYNKVFCNTGFPKKIFVWNIHVGLPVGNSWTIQCLQSLWWGSNSNGVAKFYSNQWL